MKADTAKLAVVLGVGTAVIGTTVKEVLDGKRGPSFYVPLAGALVAVPLLIASDLQPDLAGGLGILIFVAAMTYSGNAIMAAVQNASSPKGSAGQSKLTNVTKIPNPFQR